MANCGQLTWKAKNVESLSRPHDNQELWNFAEAWIRRFSETDEDNVSEKLIYLWVTVNAWASKSVPDLSRNHEDAYLVHCMAKDHDLSERFDKLYQRDIEFRDTVNSFLDLAPVFQSLWLNNHGIGPWNINDDRRKYVKMVSEKDPFIVSIRNEQEIRFPAFSPACALEHIQGDEPIPVDWPHTISMIYQVRCNLFHGGKYYNRDSDREFIKSAYKILWDVWKDELPPTVFPNKLPWARILIRSGFMAKAVGNLRIFLLEEKEENVVYLKKIVDFGRFGNVVNKIFTPDEAEIEEDLWLRAVEACHGGAEGGAADELPIMDTYMAGVVRWLNCLGIETTFSCDGHERNQAHFQCVDPSSARIAVCILNLSGQQFRQQGQRVYQQEAPPRARSTIGVKTLLDVAEWLHSNQEHLSSAVKLLNGISPARTGHSALGRSTHRTYNRRGR